MDELKIRCKVEELPFLARFIRNAYVRDQAEFAAFSSVFNSEFLTRYDFLTALIDGLISPKSLIGERKMISVRLQLHYVTTRTLINKFEEYTNLVKGSLTMNPADFGFSLIRKSIDTRNDEAIIKHLKTLVKNVDSNIEAFRKVGLTNSFRVETNDFINSFESDILDQVGKLRERKELVLENRKQFNDLWNLITRVIDSGKIIFKSKKDKHKIKDYTYSELMKNVRMVYYKQEENLMFETKSSGFTRINQHHLR